MDLYYNRFRYYDCDTGTYISQDPIGVVRNNPTLYGYVKDGNFWIDPYGLALQNGIPKNPGIVRRFMSKSEYKNFKKMDLNLILMTPEVLVQQVQK